jgi:TonB-linked SusC/RagA family outer membrane protein
MRDFRRTTALIAAIIAAALVPVPVAAQDAAMVTGRVTNHQGQPEAAVLVRIESLNVGSPTSPDGSYRMVIPGARIRPGQGVQISASRVGLSTQTRTIILSPGANLSQNFQLAPNALQLDAVVVTGAGLQTRVERLGTARASVEPAVIARTNETNVVSGLAGRVANVITHQASGEAGASTAIRIRGQSTLSGTGEPLFVIDGVPMNNATRSTTGALQGTVAPNRASDINPDDIESIEILKGPAATSVYGAQAGAAGAILITTRRGRAGRTTFTFRSSLQLDEAASTLPVQRRYGIGTLDTTPSCVAAPVIVGGRGCTVDSGFFSWGPALAAGTPTYDNVSSLYESGRIFDNALTMSGGDERTTFYLSVGDLRHDGFIAGNSDTYNRSTARLNATHRLRENLTVGGNVSYVQTGGQFVQRGNSVNGLVLGAVRTPPEFDNRVYLDPATGQHRSFRLPLPGPADAASNRGFDNPFFAAFEGENTGEVGRVYGNISTNWQALDWLRLTHTLGIDYANDDRLEAIPMGSSGAAAKGQVTRWQFYDRILDHNLVATADYSLGRQVFGSVSAGQNLNETYFRQVYVTGQTLIAPRPFKLSNTVSRQLPTDAESRDRIESYNLTGTMDVADQLFLTAGVTNFGSSRFGFADKRAWYPRAQAAWTFTAPLNLPETLLSFGKVRVAYGESGQLPGMYQLQDVFSSGLIVDFNPGAQLQPTLGGQGGLYTSFTQGNPGTRPERVTETELGMDLAFFDGRGDFSLTHYRQNASDVIFPIERAPSTGFSHRVLNAAEIQNRGWEATAGFRVVERRDLGVSVGATWARNRNELLSLGDTARKVLSNPFVGSSFAGRTTDAVVGQPLGVFQGTDFARCGRGLTMVGSEDVGAACAGRPAGALYISASGFPIQDPTTRVIGDPNPDWTGGLTAEVNFRGVRLNAFLEHRSGGTNQNMTRASMYSFGTHGDTEQRAACTSVDDVTTCTGNEQVFGQGIMPGAVAGPGAGKAVPIGENWYTTLGGIGGPSAQFQEDASYTRLREVTLGYTFSQPWVAERLGLSAIDVRLAGRNLKTWTGYSGFDPEVNVGGAAAANRGIDWMGNPLSRAWVFSLGLAH